jgi:hypothetical protein
VLVEFRNTFDDFTGCLKQRNPSKTNKTAIKAEINVSKFGQSDLKFSK